MQSKAKRDKSRAGVRLSVRTAGVVSGPGRAGQGRATAPGRGLTARQNVRAGRLQARTADFAPGAGSDRVLPNFRPKAGRQNGRAGRKYRTSKFDRVFTPPLSSVTPPYKRVSGIQLERFDWQVEQYIPVAVLWLGRSAGFRRTIRAAEIGREFSRLMTIAGIVECYG